MIEIYRDINGTGTVVCRLADDNASVTGEIMGREEVSIDITVDAPLDIRVGDRVHVDGVTYTLNREATLEKRSDVEYRYTMVFESPLYRLLDKILTHPMTGVSSFTISRTLGEWLKIVVDCVNTIDPGWTVAAGIPDTDPRNILFEDTSCREALTRLAGEFGMEYFLSGKEIHVIDRIENATGLVFEQGRGKGLYTVMREPVDTENTVTRLYPYGGTANMAPGEGDANGRLYLPERYLENFSEYGKVVEKVVVFEDIFPCFRGTVRAVSGEFNRVITCPEIDFDISKQAIGGVKAKINLLSGDLMGESFDLDWDNDKRQIDLVRREDGTALADKDGKRPLIPHDSRKAVVGDTFNLTDITMPPSYKDNAVALLRQRATDWLSYRSRLRVKFSLEVDHRYLRGRRVLMAGDLVTVKVPEAGVDNLLRVNLVERNLKTGKMSCSVSNYLDEKWEKKIEGVISDIRSAISGGVGGGISGIEIIGEHDPTPPTDRNVYSARSSGSKFLRKDIPDTASGRIAFEKGVQLGPRFIPGVLGGIGGHIDENADGELRSLRLRESLVVPSITYNNIEVISGDQASTFAFGKIKSVDMATRTASLDLLDEERGTLKVSDICRGIFHNIEGGNATEYQGDENGFMSYSGFSTAYFTPTAIVKDQPGEFVFKYSLKSGTTVHPMPGMRFYAYGNFVDKTRQTVTYETRDYTRRLKGMDTWSIDPDRNISMQEGLLEGLTIGGMVMHGYGTYSENNYFTGTQIQFTPEQLENLKGKDAYGVSLTSYETSLIAGEDEDLNLLTRSADVYAGTSRVETESRDVITDIYKLSTRIQAYKGTAEIHQSDEVEDGAYIVAIHPVGCEAISVGGVVAITKIIDPKEVYVDITVNCEGNASFDKVFRVNAIRDGKDGVDGDLATRYWLLSTVDQIGLSSTGAPEPSSFIVYSKRQTGTSPAQDNPDLYILVFRTNNKDSWAFVSSTKGASATIAPSVQYKYYRVCLATGDANDVTSPLIIDSRDISLIQDGKNGATGAMPRYTGVFDQGKTYVYDSEYRDIMIYMMEGTYYKFQVKTFGSSVTVPPSSPSGDDDWKAANDFDFVAMDTALIDGADIARFQFKDGIMQSRDIDPATNEPYLSMNGKTGEIRASRGTFMGSIGTPFKKASGEEGVLNLEDSFNLIYGAILSQKLTVKLPSSVKYQGVMCQLLNAPVITSIGGGSLRVQTEDDSLIWNTGRRHSEYKTYVDIPNGKMGRFYAVSTITYENEIERLVWYLDNYAELNYDIF